MARLNIRVEGTPAELDALVALVDADGGAISSKYVRYHDKIDFRVEDTSTVANLTPHIINAGNEAT